MMPARPTAVFTHLASSSAQPPPFVFFGLGLKLVAYVKCLHHRPFFGRQQTDLVDSLIQLLFVDGGVVACTAAVPHL